METQPLGTGNFLVEIDGVSIGVSEVSGLGFEPERRLVSPLTLRRAAGRDLTLWRWAREPRPRQVTVVLLDAQRQPVCVYRLSAARPLKWTGPNLNALSGEVAIEELVISADDMEIDLRE